MIKDIIIHIPVGPHARLPDTDSQDLNPNKGIVFPRSLFAEVRHREELNRTGVYVLWGPGGSGQLPRAYMGEGGVLLPRLDSHAKNKDFWTHGIAFTSKDQSLNKAHVQYLEARLVQLAAEAKRCELDNTNVPQMPALSGADTADAELYLADMLLCLPVVGVSFFEKPQGPTGKSRELFLSAKGIQARGYEGPGGFVVRSGSQAVKNEVASIHTYLSDLRKALLNQNIFEDTDQRYIPYVALAEPWTLEYLLRRRSQAASIQETAFRVLVFYQDKKPLAWLQDDAKEPPSSPSPER